MHVRVRATFALLMGLALCAGVLGCTQQAPVASGPSPEEAAAAAASATVLAHIEAADEAKRSGDPTEALAAYARALSADPDAERRRTTAAAAVAVLGEQTRDVELSEAIETHAWWRSQLPSDVAASPAVAGALHYDLISYAWHYVGNSGAMLESREKFMSYRGKHEVSFWLMKDGLIEPGPSRLMSAAELEAIAERAQELGEPAEVARAYRALARLAPAVEQWRAVDKQLKRLPNDIGYELFARTDRANGVARREIPKVRKAIEEAE